MNPSPDTPATAAGPGDARPAGGARHGGVAVITGAASGFGLEASRLAAVRGMQVVMADVERDALDAAAAEIGALGAQVLARIVDVARAAEVQALADATLARFGTPTLVFNNAGVGAGGLIWEHSLRDWEWVLGVNLMGVAHGVRIFTPLMLAAARADAAWRGDIVNTASMAGLLNAPNMGVYNVSKHAVVSLSETLYHDLALVTEQVHAHVVCPYFVPTGIHRSHRNRPPGNDAAGAAGAPAAPAAPTASQRIAQAMISQAVTRGKVSAAEVVAKIFDAVDRNVFYVYSHPQQLAPVRQRMDDVLAGRNPSDPFAARPEIGQALRDELRGGGGPQSDAIDAARPPG